MDSTLQLAHEILSSYMTIYGGLNAAIPHAASSHSSVSRQRVYRLNALGASFLRPDVVWFGEPIPPEAKY